MIVTDNANQSITRPSVNGRAKTQWGAMIAVAGIINMCTRETSQHCVVYSKKVTMQSTEADTGIYEVVKERNKRTVLRRDHPFIFPRPPFC